MPPNLKPEANSADLFGVGQGLKQVSHLQSGGKSGLRSFRSQLFLLVLLVLIPAFVLISWGAFQRQKAERARAKESAVTLAKLAASEQRYYVREARQLLGTVTQFDFLVLGTNRQFCEFNLTNLKLLSPDFLDFGLIETNGTVFCNTFSNQTDALVIPSLAAKVLHSRDFAVGGYFCSPVLGEPALQFGFPVFGEDGGVQRIMYASLRAPLLSEALAEIPLPLGGVVNVLDRSGIVIARYPDDEQFSGKRFESSGYLKSMLQETTNLFEADGLDGKKRLYAVTKLLNGNQNALFVGVGLPRKESFATAHQMLITDSAIMLAVGLLVFFLGQQFSERNFIRPVGAMLDSARRLMNGDLAARTGLSHGRTELHLLAQTFDEMASKLQERQAEINRNHLELEQKVRERTSELETLNRELEAFSYSVSHDLRAPLRHMNGFAQILSAEKKFQEDSQASRYLGLITKSARQMGTLIDDLLSFSRMARQKLAIETVDFAGMVALVIKDSQSTEPNREIQWNVCELPNVRGDSSMLKQVWINLLSNALKYTRGKSPAVITVQSRAENGELIFSVADNGAGFDMAYADKLFGVFQRLHRDDEFEGTGIGLANVRRVIHRHGGRTWAEGSVGVGATFFFSIPTDMTGKNQYA